MKVHTNNFKNALTQLGRRISAKIIYYPNYELITEDSNNVLTESSLKILSENADFENGIEIPQDELFKIDIIKNGNLFQSLMKQVNFEAKTDLNVGTFLNVKFGVFVNNDFEYLDYGIYIIKSKEYNMESQTWSYICYDKMLFSMIEYKQLQNGTFPMTIRQYIQELCNELGLEYYYDPDEPTGFSNINELIYEDVYKNKGMTYRDIFDDIAEILSGFVLINNNEQLEVKTFENTEDIIDEDFLDDVNVTIGKKYEPVNAVSIIDEENDLQYTAKNQSSIDENGLSQLNIRNNLLTLNGNSSNIAYNILFHIADFYYYLIDLNTKGVCYYDFLDIFFLKYKNEYYQCVLLNSEITIAQGLHEQIFNEEYQEIVKAVGNYKTSIQTNSDLQFKINQQDSRIESKVAKNGVISAINQSAEEIQIEANKISLEGKEINLTSDNTTINSTNFSVDSSGNLSCTHANLINANFTVSDVSSSSGPYITMSSGDLFDGTITTSLSNGILDIRNETNSGGATLIEPKITLYWEVPNQTTTLGASGCYSPAFVQTSSAEKKKNFEKFENATEIVKKTDIYKYNWEAEEKSDKKHIGLIIGEKYNTPNEIISNNGEGIDLYAMISVLWQSNKEQQEEIDKLKEMIKNGKY